LCQTCNGTGHINVDYGWGYGFYPCPDPECDFDREKAMKESADKLERKIERLLQKC